MVDVVSKIKRSQMMAGIRSKNTKPELLVRKLLHNAGFRYRLHDKKLPGNPDIVLRKYSVAIFVHGCFWHGHDDCALFRLPKSRTEFWKSKIEGNVLRDQKKNEALLDKGWRICVIWECALKGKTRISAEEVFETLSNFILKEEKSFLVIRGR